MRRRIGNRRAPSFATAAAFTLLASTVSAQVGIEHQKLVASDGGAGDEFGVNLALDGDTLVVSADQDNGAAGSVYVFVRGANGVWTQVQKLNASNAGATDEFGYSVSVSGTWIAVSARLEDTGTTDAGMVYMFQNQGGTWVETQKIQASDRGNGDHFGSTLDLEGDRMVVCAPRNDDGSTNTGTAYIFERSGSTWNEVAMLVASDRANGDLLGSDCDLGGDRVVVSTVWDDNLTGAAYVFERQGGGNWVQTQKIVASDKAVDDEFGSACALDGNLLLVGARLEEAAAPNAGSVYAYEYNGSTWVQTDKFQGSDTANGDQFGFSIGLDGTRAVIGAYRSNPNGQDNGGKLYVVERRGDGQWIELAKMYASDAAQEDFLGFCSDISGQRIAGGAVWEDQKGVNSGSVYVAESEFLRSDDGISVSAGGTVDFHINLGFAEAGANYWVLGTFTGITPGVVLNGVSVPLNWDLYLLMTITGANQAPFSTSRGVLDSEGGGKMSISAPGGLDPALIGLELHHAVCTFSNAGGIKFTSASHPAPIVMQN